MAPHSFHQEGLDWIGEILRDRDLSVLGRVWRGTSVCVSLPTIVRVLLFTHTALGHFVPPRI